MSAYADDLRAAAARLGRWRDLPFFSGEGFAAVLRALAAEKGSVLPPAHRAFTALELTPPDAVRAVILGQDPYPTPGHAMGLAFSVAPDVRPLPRSLNNIYRELQDDLGHAPENGDLSIWARNGVLLLNTALTVRAGEAGSHARIGWGALVDEVIRDVAARDGIVWLLWGRHAQAKRALIESGGGANRLILESAHPSPLSARRGFFGSRHFGKAEKHAGRVLFGKS